MTKKIKVKIRPEQFGCNPDYFNRFIKDKPLSIVKEYTSMITIEDENNERWNIFNGNYTVHTGL